MTRANLEHPSSLFRSTIARGLRSDSVDRKGGDYSAGLIKRTAIITPGEALGHGLWIDANFSAQIVDAINASGSTGIKARFTHPDASGDALGSFTGRIKDATLEDGKAVADLHLAGSAHDTPDGDLATYLMTLAEESPEVFGQSIAFSRNLDAELAFLELHGAESPEFDGFEWTGLDGFQSPDPENVENLPHTRLSDLKAVDAVDSPAANPDGLFHRGARAVAKDAEGLLSYAFGLTPKAPPVSAFSINPTRAAQFLTRFLDRNGLTITPRPEPLTMSENTDQNTPDTTPETNPTRADLLAQMRSYVETFGAENGARWFSEGLSREEALTNHVTALTERLAIKEEQVDELQATISALRTGEETPIDLGSTQADDPDTNTTKLGIRIAGED